MNNYRESILKNYRNALNATRTTEYCAYIAHILGDVMLYEYESVMSIIEDGNQEAAIRCKDTFMAVLNSDIMGISDLTDDCENAIREFYILVGGNNSELDNIKAEVQAQNEIVYEEIKEMFCI